MVDIMHRRENSINYSDVGQASENEKRIAQLIWHFENADQNILYKRQAWLHSNAHTLCIRGREEGNERKVQSAVAGAFLSECYDL